MKKPLLFIVIAIVIVIAGVGVYLYNSIDAIVKNAIEREGSAITGTKVSVGSVDISLKTGRGTLRDLKVENPDGYADENAIELAEIIIDLDVGSLNRDPIIIQEIRIVSPVVNAELNEKASSNVGEIRDHVKSYQTGAAKPASGKQDAGYEKHFTIRSFVIEEGVLSADATRVGSKEWEYQLAPQRLSNVGGARGALPDALGREISGAIFNQATQAVTDRLKANAAERVIEKLGDVLKK